MINAKQPCLVLAIASALCVSSPAFSDSSSTSSDDIGELSLEKMLDLEVVTASKSAQKASEAPATVYVITAENIAHRGYRDLEELLEDIPEVEIQHKSVAEYNNWYTFRGIAGNDKFIVLLDGFRIASPTGTPHAIAHNYGLADAKRVEVILGPASALYGADAFGGIVNIITKTGADTEGFQIHASGGNFGTHDSSIIAGYHKDQLSISLNIQTYHSDEPNFANEYRSDFSWYNEHYKTEGQVLGSPFPPNNVPISLGEIRPYETPTDAHFFHLGIRAGELELGYAQAYETHNDSVGMRPEFNLYAADAKFTTKVDNMFLRHTYSFSDNHMTLQSSLSHARYELLPETEFLNTFTFYRDGFKYEQDKSTKLEEQLNISVSEKNALVMGLTYEDVSALPKTGDLPFRFNPDTPAASQGEYYIGTNFQDENGHYLTVPQVFYYVNYTNTGAYAQWQSTLAEGLKLTAGARYDDNSRYGTTTNPRIGLVYQPNSALTFKLLHSEGFLAPSPYVAFQHYGSFVPDPNDPKNKLVGFFWHLPNPNLKPERLKSDELSAAWTIGDHARLSFDYYHSKIKDLITPVVFSSPTPGVFDGTFQNIPVFSAEIPVNVGKSDIKGETLRLDTLHQLGGITLNGHLAFSHSDGTKGTKPPTGTPFKPACHGGADELTYSAENTLKGGLEMSLGGFSMYPQMLHRSPTRQQMYDDSCQHLENEAFTRWDLYSQYELAVGGHSKIDFFVKILNLFNKKFYNVSFGQEESFYATPQDPRRIELGVDYRY